jgi:hypothetical protein
MMAAGTFHISHCTESVLSWEPKVRFRPIADVENVQSGQMFSKRATAI